MKETFQVVTLWKFFNLHKTNVSLPCFSSSFIFFILFLCSLNFSLFPLLHSSWIFFFVSFNWDWYHMLYVDIVIVVHLIYMKDSLLSSHFIHTQKPQRLIQVHFIIFIKLILPWLDSIALCRLSLANLTCKPSFDDDECSWINIGLCERVSERERKNNKCKSKVFRGYEDI